MKANPSGRNWRVQQRKKEENTPQHAVVISGCVSQKHVGKNKSRGTKRSAGKCHHLHTRRHLSRNVKTTGTPKKGLVFDTCIRRISHILVFSFSHILICNPSLFSLMFQSMYPLYHCWWLLLLWLLLHSLLLAAHRVLHHTPGSQSCSPQ